MALAPAAAAPPRYPYGPALPPQLPYAQQLQYGVPGGYGVQLPPGHAGLGVGGGAPQPVFRALPCAIPTNGGARPGPAGGRDPLTQLAISINKRITAAQIAADVFAIVERESQFFDTVCLATAMHQLACLRGAPNLHAQIVQAPEFFKLKQLILERRGELTARNISNMLWSLAKINHHPGDEFLAALAGEIRTKAKQGGNAQNVANVLWAFGTLGFDPGQECMEALAEALRSKLDECTSQNMSNAVLAFAKLEFDPGQETLEALAQAALHRLPTFSPQALSNTLWGLSKLGIQADELMEAIGRAARSQLYEYNSQNLANSVWAYANLNLDPGEELLQAYAAAAKSRMAEFSPQNISNFLWACAKLGYRNHDLMADAARHGARVMHVFTPQSIANMIWAYATLDEWPDRAFLQALVAQALRLLPDFTPQNLSNTAWALATLKECDAVRTLNPALLAAIAGEVTRRLQEPEAAGEFSRQHLANFVWALATLEHDPGKRALLAIADALVNRADLCNPQEVSNSVWAFAKLGQYHGPLMHAMAAEATRRIDEFSQQNLSNLAWAYAKLAHLDEELLGAIADRAEGMAGELSLQHCSNIIWAYASLKWSTPTLMPTLVKEVSERMTRTQFNVQQLSNLLWSLAIAEHCGRPVWDLCMAQLATVGIEYRALPAEALTQVFQAYMLALAQAPGQEWPIAEALLGHAQHAWIQSTKKIKISEFHAEVSRMLSALGVGHTIEHLTEDHLFSVDCALPDERIALEVDGPHHFTANTFRPLGEMYCRHALLRARGWRVVSVPFYHWSGESDDNRQALLLRVVAEARREPVPEVHPAQAAVSARLSVVRDEYAAKAAAWEREQQQQELQHSMLRHSAAAAGAQPPMAAANPPPAGPTAASAAKPEFVQTRSTPTGAGGPAGLFSPAGPPVLTPRAPREQPAVHQPSPQQQAPQQAEWQPWAPPPPHPSDQPQLVAAKAAALDVLNGLVATAPLAAPMVPPSVFAQVAPPASRLVPPPQPQQPQQARGAAPVGRLGSAPLFLQPPPGLLAPAPQPSSQPTSEALAAVEAAARALKGTGGRAPLAIAPISRSSSGGVGSQQSGSPASASSGRGEA